MKKYIKWGIVAVVIIAVAVVMGIRAFVPQVNEELSEEKVAPVSKQKQILNYLILMNHVIQQHHQAI